MRALTGFWVALLILSGCGGEKRPPQPPSGEAVIRAWTDAVREGDFATANDLFALPARVFNGGPTIQLERIDQVDAFNRGFPCGAVLEGTQETAESHVLATFRLVKARGVPVAEQERGERHQPGHRPPSGGRTRNLA